MATRTFPIPIYRSAGANPVDGSIISNIVCCLSVRGLLAESLIGRRTSSGSPISCYMSTDLVLKFGSSRGTQNLEQCPLLPLLAWIFDYLDYTVFNGVAIRLVVLRLSFTYRALQQETRLQRGQGVFIRLGRAKQPRLEHTFGAALTFEAFEPLLSNL